MTAQEFFKNDRFATNAGVKLIEIKESAKKNIAGRITLTVPKVSERRPTIGLVISKVSA